VLDVYQRLDERRLSPAPLVPTTVPASVGPIDRTIGTSPARRGYAVRLLRFHRGGSEAIVLVTGGEHRTIRAFLRDQRRLGFGKPQRLRIRGRRGYLSTRRHGPVVRVLAWSEGGVVYTVASGTPRKVSLGGLRSTAEALDRLEGAWIGGSADPESSSEGFAVTTARTITASVAFQATCAPPGAPEATIQRVGRAAVTLIRRDGERFAFDIAQNRRGSGLWEGTVTGTISPAGVTIELRATGTVEGDACDTGPVTLTLARAR
jgi:hypothetical protein